jgi:hypothetical protein
MDRLCGLVFKSFWQLTQKSRVRFRNWVLSALVKVNEELLERKSSGSGLEN